MIDELVAAEAGHGVLPADGSRQALADRDEQLVAGVVAEAVVHDLEPVEVEEQAPRPSGRSSGSDLERVSRRSTRERAVRAAR